MLVPDGRECYNLFIVRNKSTKRSQPQFCCGGISFFGSGENEEVFWRRYDAAESFFFYLK